jgi:predicted ATP-dependent endonuclease of OLD family
MKLAKIRIENFRQLGTNGKPFELDFRDSLGRVRDFTLLVGPNTSGKTTILDAIAVALGSELELPATRPGFKLSPRNVVTHGKVQAKIECLLTSEQDEFETTKVIAELTRQVPNEMTDDLRNYQKLNQRMVTLWEYPGHRSEAYPFPARARLAHLIATGAASWDLLKRVGGVFTFDQDRAGFAKTVSRQVWNIIHGVDTESGKNAELKTTDAKTILTELALQSLVPPINGSSSIANQFAEIQQRYKQVCAPHEIIGVVRDELNEFTVRFSDGKHEYDYDGLSSGEKMVLLLLIRFVTEHIHQSIVLIDELELNQHPLWQRKILHMLPKMGENNQIIATTHSPYLRDAVPPDCVIDLGDLGDYTVAETK